MSYEELFTQYGRRSDDGRVDIRGYFGRPEKQDKLESVIYQDQTAARLIRECLETVELLEQGRWAAGGGYILASVGLCLAGVLLGRALVWKIL